jgi:hypothetical protein
VVVALLVFIKILMFLMAEVGCVFFSPRKRYCTPSIPLSDFGPHINWRENLKETHLSVIRQQGKRSPPSSPRAASVLNLRNRVLACPRKVKKCKFVRCQSVKVRAQKGRTLTPRTTCELFCPRTQGHKGEFVGCQSVTSENHFGIPQPWFPPVPATFGLQKIVESLVVSRRP